MPGRRDSGRGGGVRSRARADRASPAGQQRGGLSSCAHSVPCRLRWLIHMPEPAPQVLRQKVTPDEIGPVRPAPHKRATRAAHPSPSKAALTYFCLKGEGEILTRGPPRDVFAGL
jgi:hypothetical protein